MKVFSVALLIIVMMSMAFAADITNTEYSCLNNQTIQKHIFVNNGTANVTTSYEKTQCAYGCTDDACKEPTGDFLFAFTAGTILTAIGFCFIFIIGRLNQDNEHIKSLFLFMGLFMFISAFLVVGIIGSQYIGTTLYGISQTILGIASVLLVIISFLIAYFMIMWIKATIEALSRR